jgi:hypothetical protein
LAYFDALVKTCFEPPIAEAPSVNAHLVFFVAGLAAGKCALDDERGELLAIDFREDHVEIGKAAVRDPHFLTVENVVRAFFVQFGASERILRVRSCLWFRKAIRADQFG